MATATQEVPQHLLALRRANSIRLERAALKRAIKGGRKTVSQVVLDCPFEAESMSLSELLCSQTRWGMARARKLLVSVQMSEAKKVGSLTDRQQRLLVAALDMKLRGQEVVS